MLLKALEVLGEFSIKTDIFAKNANVGNDELYSSCGMFKAIGVGVYEMFGENLEIVMNLM